MEPQRPCARIVADVPQIDPDHLIRTTFDNGLAEVRIERAEIAYVRRDGRAVSVLIVDNGADPFRKGWCADKRLDDDITPWRALGCDRSLRAHDRCSAPTMTVKRSNVAHPAVPSHEYRFTLSPKW